MNRRKFLAAGTACSLSCSTYLQTLAATTPRGSEKILKSTQDKVVASEKWAKIQKIADGIFAIISTPFEARDFTTVCNGGLIVGSKRTLVVEAFMQTKGAKWVAEQAKVLGKREPTDVVVTHYHGDHSSGHKGLTLGTKSPRIWLTDSTKTEAENSFKKQNQENNFSNVASVSTEKPSEIDLGDRKVSIVPRSGHTKSDVTIEVTDPRVVFCGDLFFHKMFPNYLDAQPSQLLKFAQQMSKDKDAIMIPGHGPVAGQPELKKYIDFLQFVENHARQSREAGKSAVEATKTFDLPQKMSEWLIWSPQVVERAMTSWYRELND